MVEASNYIRIGFFKGFRGYDTVLISVDIGGLLEIENAFAELSQGLSFLDLSKLCHLDEKFHADIKAHNDTINSGLKQIDKGKFEWLLTKNKWRQFREMATALYRLGTSGHQYLDTETGDVNSESLQVILSLNEYSLSFWQEHF